MQNRELSTIKSLHQHPHRRQATAFAVLLLVAWASPSRSQESLSAEPMSLQDLIREAQDHNPAVQMVHQMVEAKRARVPQAGALGDPMLMYGVVNEGSPIPFETLGEKDFSEVYVGITQDLPFPGKRGLREKVADEELSASEWTLEAARRRVAADVAEAYYDLYAVRAALDVVGRTAQLLDQLTRVARTRFEVGRASQQDVLDAEVELSRLEEHRTVLAQRQATLEASLSRALGRVSPPPIVSSPPVEETPLLLSLEELLQRGEAESPVVKEKERQMSREERNVDLSRRERLPDLGVNAAYHNRGGLDPYYAFGGTLTLPIYSARKQSKAIEEATANLGAARSDADATKAEVRYEITEAYQEATSTDRLLRLYEEGLLKQARLSFDSATAQYEVGKVDFLTLSVSWKRLLDYQLAYHEQLAKHEKAMARLAVHVRGVTKEVF